LRHINLIYGEPNRNYEHLYLYMHSVKSRDTLDWMTSPVINRVTDWVHQIRDRERFACAAYNSLLSFRKGSTPHDFPFAHGRSFSVQPWEWFYLLQWNKPNRWLSPIKVQTTQHQHAVHGTIITRDISRINQMYENEHIWLCLQTKHCQQTIH